MSAVLSRLRGLLSGLSRSDVKAFLLLLLTAILFNWKIVLTHQFSQLSLYEGANQAYSWYNFWIHSVRAGQWPWWDPYAFSGHTFVGEMQTGAFYPVNFVLALFPMNDRGLFSPALYHWLYVATQATGAFLMFRLAREVGVSVFAAFVAGLCFAFGGIESRAGGWPHFFQSFIWLPLLMLFLLRAMRSAGRSAALVYASLSGLCLGMTVLAGGLHVAIMDSIVIVSAVVFDALQGSCGAVERWRRAVMIAGTALAVGACAGAVQLLPSMEYSGLAFRYLGSTMQPAASRIPYAYMKDGFLPNTLGAFVFANRSDAFGPGEVLNPYMGVFPLLAAVVGVWKNWGLVWVRYLTGLAAGTFLFALGSFSLLHGVLYAVVPELWLAREGNRFLYLADFALALLAAYGIDALFATSREHTWDAALKVFRWIGIGCAVALAAAPALGMPAISPWNTLSLLLIVVSVVLAGSIMRGNRGAWNRALVIGLVLFDLGAFDWSARNEIQERAAKTEEMDRLLSCQGAVDFLRTRPGPFRVQVEASLPPNIGDLFGVETTWGAGVTVLQDYEPIRGRADLLNVRYALRPASANEPGALYQDRDWKVYEKADAGPRVWLASTAGAVRLKEYDARRPTAQVHAAGAGMLVFSEIDYPGWRATVNGKRTEIVKVNGGLRGVRVAAGESRVEMSYAPVTIWVGGVVTVMTWLGVLAGWWVIGRR